MWCVPPHKPDGNHKSEIDLWRLRLTGAGALSFLFRMNDNLRLAIAILRNCSHIRRIEIHPLWKVWIFYDTNLERNRREDLLNGASFLSIAPSLSMIEITEAEADRPPRMKVVPYLQAEASGILLEGENTRRECKYSEIFSSLCRGDWCFALLIQNMKVVENKSIDS